MCVIYACATHLPPEEELRRGAFRNDHGAGLAWVDKTQKVVQWVKGLKDEKEVLDKIKELKVEPPLMIHFRIASVGGKLSSLTHPFPVDKMVPLWLEGYAPEVLMHNGHLSNWEDLALRAGLSSREKFPEGAWSDSRALAWLVHLKGLGVLPFVASTSRVAVLAGEPYWETPKGEPEDPWDYFHLYGNWVETTRENGWIASISTDYTNVGGRRVGYRGAADYDIEDLDETPAAGTRHSQALTVVPKAPDNVWTVEELTVLLSNIEGELREAQDAAGLQ